MTEEQQDLREALKKTAVALKEGGVDFALGGGYAVWALGGQEPVHDVDFVVPEDEAQRAEQVLARAGLRVEHPPEDWLFKVYDGPAMADLIFRVNGRPVDAALLQRARQVEVCSIDMPVLSATDLLIGKALALSEHSCDLGRVLPSARALREQVDWAAVRRAAAGNPYARALLHLLAELEVAPAADPG